MKDVYMANLLSKNNDTEINLDDCPVVVRFRKALFYKRKFRGLPHQDGFES